MSHEATNWAIKQRGLKPTTKIVLWHLCDRFNPDYGCFPSQDRLAHDCEISRSTLNDHLGQLEAVGLLRRVPRLDPVTKRQLPTRYILGFEPGFTPVAVVPCPEIGHGEDDGAESLDDADGCDVDSMADALPCPDFGHGFGGEAVSDFPAEPCPENLESRVRISDTNPVREPLSKPVKEEEGAQASKAISDEVFGELLDALGLDPAALPGWWQGWPPRLHVQRWCDELGLTEAEIIAAAEASRQEHPEPPDGPKALDRAMQRAAQRKVEDAGRKRRKPKAAPAPATKPITDLPAFYADLVNSDRYLPVSAISNTMRDAMLARGLVTAERLIDATDEVTDRVLDRLGDPRNLSPWSRRGMVVGHVQSGKTANYTGLICKAADAGYRLIVVIAGIHNNLRNQTQARIDEGFIGRDTGRLAHANKAQRQKIIGVGQFDQREFPVSLTNTLRDFNKATATTNTSQIGQYNVPVVLVIKKNTSTLKNLLEWLKEHSVHQGTQMVSQPMLLIDDEADNASINTAYARDEVTRINGQLRELLSLFHRSCYVGYTATPFANIFIDPDTDDETLKQDLFPRHFIIGLDAPSNYFGAQKVFLDARDQHVRLIDDNEDILPMKHKIDHPVDVLPESLIRAVRAFVVARAIRNARGQQGRTLNYGDDFETCLTLLDTAKAAKRDEKAKQAMTEGINAQAEVVTLGAEFWSGVLAWGRERKRLTPKDMQILEVCASMPRRIPSDLQARHALDVLGRMRDQGLGES